MTKSPLRRQREALGLSIEQIALAAGMSYQALWNAEKGYCSMPQKLASMLADLGVDAADLAAEHDRWRAVQGNLIRQRVRQMTGKDDDHDTGNADGNPSPTGPHPLD